MKNKIFSLLISLFCVTPLIYSGKKATDTYTIVNQSTKTITCFLIQQNGQMIMSCPTQQAAEQAIEILKKSNNVEAAAQAVVTSQNSNSGECSIQ